MSETPAPAPARPVPVPDAVSAPFWEACVRHELVVQRCAACGRARWHPRPMCPWCQSLDAVWSPAGGDATLYSWVVAHRPLLPAFEPLAPLPVLLVELAEGVRMLGNLASDVDAGTIELRFGMPLKVDFEDVADGVTLPVWQPLLQPPPAS